MTTQLWHIQILSCFFMTGLIWVIQWVHYPSFRFIEQQKFSEFHLFHSNRITWIVAPAMGLELLSSIALVLIKAPWSLLNMISVLVLWGITALVSIPCHMRLKDRFNEAGWKPLVWTNWSRTLIWSLRSALLFYYMELL